MIGQLCAAPAGGGLVSGILDFVDCQSEAIGIGGYQALAAPGSPLSITMTILLTLFIAMFGYRLILGERLGLRDGVLAFLKVGIVFTLAFNWSAYRTLIYDVALKAPAEAASTIGRSAGLPGADSGLAARLDGADRAYVVLNALGSGGGRASPTSTLQAAPVTAQSGNIFDPFALGAARVIFLLGSLTGFVGLRLVAGLLLALGPIFIGFLLFNSTRGLFEGWVRVLTGAAVGVVGVAIILGVQLALLEPRLAELVAWRSAGYAIPGAAAELLVISLVFTLATGIFIMAAWRLMSGFAFPAVWRPDVSQVAERPGNGDQRPTSPALAVVSSGGRAEAIANSVSISQQRGAEGVWASGPGERSALPHDSRLDAQLGQAIPLGQGGRRNRGRTSAGSQRRDLV